MSTDKNQKIIKELNEEGLSKPYALTFVFLRGYGTNQLKKPLPELSKDSGIPRRSLRQNLYKLDAFGLIEYKTNPGDVNSIILKRYKHT